MTMTEFVLHLVVFVGPLALALGWQHLNDLPLRAGRWTNGRD